MEVSFATDRLYRLLHSLPELTRTYGRRRALAIMNRVAALHRFPTLSQVPITPPFRRHQLTGDRDEQYAVDVDTQCRLIFAPHHDPVPRLPDGGIDTALVTSIIIIAVLDYH